MRKTKIEIPQIVRDIQAGIENAKKDLVVLKQQQADMEQERATAANNCGRGDLSTDAMSRLASAEGKLQMIRDNIERCESMMFDADRVWKDRLDVTEALGDVLDLVAERRNGELKSVRSQYAEAAKTLILEGEDPLTAVRYATIAGNAAAVRDYNVLRDCYYDMMQRHQVVVDYAQRCRLGRGVGDVLGVGDCFVAIMQIIEEEAAR